MRLLLILSLLTSSTPALAQPATCSWTASFQCPLDQACKPQAATEWGVFDRAASTYRRCTAQGCGKPLALVRKPADKALKADDAELSVSIEESGAVSLVRRLERGVVFSRGRCAVKTAGS